MARIQLSIGEDVLAIEIEDNDLNAAFSIFETIMERLRGSPFVREKLDDCGVEIYT
ncbi:MAG: hypothetical protein SBU_000099 [Candidatus Syntrophoarchaeum butanivorans]|uniref:Uncharacterized protein n=1 Tax=Candidatus Syntropharchaeum butanivorans TaxID=1839936 RepID=A0A1F2P866_9EURY|nr:MAG: hypothetical protein SBU_000099 [Candidatus Syntrophoarchaeum butanivorans]